MDIFQQIERENEKGFTLVELAVVMIIIGLLIGGILKGQELINNAQVSATVAQAKAVQASLNTFQDTYSAMPGDITNPDERLPNCAGWCASAGDGNGRIDAIALDAAMANDDENTNAWLHMAVTDLLGGYSGEEEVAWGQAAPASELGGGFHVAFTNGGNEGSSEGTLRGGHWVNLRGSPDYTTAEAMTASQAARIDRKMDDGAPGTGSVIADDVQAGECAEDADTYDEAQDLVACGLFIRVQ